jgi:hypothetical protein
MYSAEPSSNLRDGVTVEGTEVGHGGGQHMHPHILFLPKNYFFCSVEKGQIKKMGRQWGKGAHVYEGLVQTNLPYLSYLSPS